MTGSHRIYAAREAGVEISVVIITEDNIKNEDDAELLSSLLEANRNDERFNIAFDLYEKGLISKSAKDLIAREEDLTYDYYENIEEAPRFSVVQDEKLLDELEKGETVTIGDEVDATGFDEYLEERAKEEGITSKEDIN